jgi:hypothetical protein
MAVSSVLGFEAPSCAHQRWTVGARVAYLDEPPVGRRWRVAPAIPNNVSVEVKVDPTPEKPDESDDAAKGTRGPTLSVRNPLLAFAGIAAGTPEKCDGPNPEANAFRVTFVVHASDDPVTDQLDGRHEDEGDDAELYARIGLIRNCTLGGLASGIINNSVDDLDARAIFEGLIFPLLGKLAAARGDATAKAALRVAVGAVRVLLDPRKWDVEIVRQLGAIAQGFDAADSNAAAIVELAEMVERSTAFRRMNDPSRHGFPFENPTAMVGEHAPKMLHEWLAGRYGADRVPTLDEIAGMLDRHTERRAKGKLTTAGIVARIIDHGRLLGANVGGEKAMLDRVDKVLKRHPR